jgi:hypothetical protein
MDRFDGGDAAANGRMPLQDILLTPHDTWSRLKHPGLANFITSQQSLFEYLGGLTTLDIRPFYGIIGGFPHPTFLKNIKEKLVDAKVGAFGACNPSWTLRSRRETGTRHAQT